MRTVRFDSVGGASGNMLLGALIDLGADRQSLVAQLRTLPVEGFDLVIAEVVRRGQIGRRQARPQDLVVGPFRKVVPDRALVGQSQVSDRARGLALAAFERLAVAEAAVHGTTPEAVHFHEVGAMDAIVDIVGACVCLDLLRIDAVTCSALPVGTGTVEAAHGVLPLPVPATARLLQDTPVRTTALPFELVTPTGAALLTTWLARLPGAPGEAGYVRSIGTGFGTRELPDRPNMLRAMLIEADQAAEPVDTQAACHVLEFNIDDMSPEWVGALHDRLLAGGALDVFTTAVQMKKQRPGVLLTVLCHDAQRAALLDIIFSESTTFGVREYPVRRSMLARDWVSVETPYGSLRIKQGRWKGRIVTRAPEYEDCAAAAELHAVPLKSVYEAVLQSMEGTQTRQRKPEEGT